MNNQISETIKEHAATLHTGLIHEIDEDTYRVKVILPDMGDMITHWLDIPERSTQDDKTLNTIDKGAQVSVLLSANGQVGVVLGSVYSEEDPPPVKTGDRWHHTFKDGTVIEYDRKEHKVNIDAQGEISIHATGPIKIKGDQDVTIEAQSIKLKATTVNVEATTLAKIDAKIIELKAPLVKTGPLLVEGLISFVPPTP